MAFRRSWVRIPLAPPSPRSRRQPDPSPGPARGSFVHREWGLAAVTTSDSATTDARDARSRIERYDPSAIEPKWQARWDELHLYEPDLEDDSKPRFYLLT